MVTTTIKLTTRTKSELDLFREHQKESYDEVIQKLVYVTKTARKKPQLSQSTVKAIDEARERFKKGIFITEKEAAKRFGL